jgi:hypothetical protein
MVAWNGPSQKGDNMFQRFFETKRREKTVNVTDGLFAIAGALEDVSLSIDELARRQGDSTDVGEALQAVADNLKDGMDSIAGEIGGA